MSVYLSLNFVGFDLCRFSIKTIKMHPAQIVLFGSTLCVMITVHFAMKLLSGHVLNWKKPKEQKAIVIIILMAPLYALDSYVGLINFFWR